VPPCKLARRREQRKKGHQVVFDHRLGFRLSSTMLVGLLMGLFFARLAGGGASCRPKPRRHAQGGSEDRLVAKMGYFEGWSTKLVSWAIVRRTVT
jgi:hypothetical protein